MPFLGSPLRAAISSAIIRLNEDRTIASLKEKWWRQERGGGACAEEEEGASVSELGMVNVGGIFLVLGVGIVVGSALAALEYCVGRWNKSITY